MFEQMDTKPDTPKVGVGVVLWRKNKILLLKRTGSHGAGEWSLPGGHLELGETFFDCCQREVLEEVGISIVSVKKMGFSNDIMNAEGLHYVTLFFETREWAGVVRNLEPEKCSEFGWFDADRLPQPSFGPLKQLCRERQG